MNKISNSHAKKRVMDFSNCKYLGEIHQIIQGELELPNWYGANLDALWDAVTGIMYVPADITIIFSPKTNETKNLTEEVQKIIDVFDEAKNKYHAITLNIQMPQ